MTDASQPPPTATPATRPELEPQDVVLRFLQSVGRPEEARFYLDLFRATPREQFAAIAVDAHVMADAADAVVLDLKFLAALELFPVVVLGLFQPAESGAHARKLRRRLDGSGVASQVVDPGDPDLAASIRRLVNEDAVPILTFAPAPGEQAPARIARLGVILSDLRSRKLLFLHRPGGLRQRGALVPLVNLSTDVPALLASRELTRKEALIVEEARTLCDRVAPRPFSVAVTSPLNLLRELFTVKGAGTLLRRGARIVRHEGWQGVDIPRLRSLVTASFGRDVVPAFFDREVSRVFVEEDYRGCAIVLDTPLGAYLTKFAVSPEARGEGIARELWDDLFADSPVLFWRARGNNPIGEWYAKLCDGLVRSGAWTVYWKGLAPAAIPAAIEHALAQPVDVP